MEYSWRVLGLLSIFLKDTKIRAALLKIGKSIWGMIEPFKPDGMF